MNLQQISDVLRLLQVEKYTVSEQSISLCCPLARWTHQAKEDTHPSAVIYVATPAKLYCYACKSWMPLWEVVETIGYHTKNQDLLSRVSDLRAYERVTRKRKCLAVADHFTGFPDSKNFRPLDLDTIENFSYPPPPAIDYLEKRGTPHEALAEFDLRYDFNDHRLVFPVSDRFQNLQGFVGRSIIGASPPYKNYLGYKSGSYFLGEHKLHDFKTVIVVEGFFDLLRCYQWAWDHEIDVLCSTGCNLTANHIGTLLSLNKNIWVAFDPDDAGEKGWKKAQKQLKSQYTRLRKLVLTKDISDYSKQEFETLINPERIQDGSQMDDAERFR